ncbi:MAG: hypothetical protein ACRD88_12235, partial [Terriglobia bacterium]
QVADLPLNGRNYLELSLLQPGVIQHQTGASNARFTGAWFSTNGAPPRSNYYILDGTPVGNVDGGTAATAAGTTLGVEGIREWRLLTNSYSAEFGMRMGGQMTMVSKGGTNQFHGSLFEYLRNSALDARNFFDYKTETTPRRLPAFTRNQFGGSVGGPIRQDRLFFFATYEGLRERLGVTRVPTVIPTAAKVDGGLVPQIVAPVRPILALFPDPNLSGNRYTFPATQSTSDNYGQARGDYIFSTNDTFFARYTIDRGDKSDPLAYPQFTRLPVSRNTFVTVAETHTFNPLLLGTFRFSVAKPRFDIDTVSGISGPQVSLVPGQEIGTINIGNVTGFGPDNTTPSLQNQSTYAWSGDLFYNRGRHSLKFGTLIGYNRLFVEVQLGGRGTVSFANIADFLSGQTASYSALTPSSDNKRNYHYKTFGFYLQDDLRATSNLTLNLGLRYEFTTDWVEVNGRGTALRDVRRDAAFTPGLAFQNPSLKNLSPRFGFAWDVRGDGQTAVRGGFGLLYDIAVYAQQVGNVSVASLPYSSQSSITTPGTFAVPLFFPASAVGRAVRTMQYDQRNPHMLTWNLAVERQLPAEMSLSLAYAGSRGYNLQNSNDGNPTQHQVENDHFFWPMGVTRINPNWANIQYHVTNKNSWYNALQLVLNKRLSRGLQFQSSYTWGKTLDEGTGVTVSDGGTGRNTSAMPRSLDKSLANWNAAHTWRFNAIYRLPQMPLQGFLDKMLNGWWTSGILSLRTGLPFTPGLSSNTRTRSQGPSAPELNEGRNNEDIVQGAAGSCAGPRAGLPLGGPEIYFDPCAFSVPPPGFMGSAGRNILIGPGSATMDFSLVKDTALGLLGESGKLEFRAEIFNLLNRANFSNPSADVYAGTNAAVQPVLDTAGLISSTSTTSRQIQLALKVVW